MLYIELLPILGRGEVYLIVCAVRVYELVDVAKNIQTLTRNGFCAVKCSHSMHHIVKPKTSLYACSTVPSPVVIPQRENVYLFPITVNCLCYLTSSHACVLAAVYRQPYCSHFYSIYINWYTVCVCTQTCMFLC